jgi:hypothetical protein
MSRHYQIAIAWLLLPVMLWVGLQVYQVGMGFAWQAYQTHGLHPAVMLLVLLVAGGHAALMAWPLLKIYGRAAGVVSFVMIWPVLWHYMPALFPNFSVWSVSTFWMLALGSYVVLFWAAVQLVLRSLSPSAKRGGRVTVETLIRRYVRQAHQPKTTTPSVD